MSELRLARARAAKTLSLRRASRLPHLGHVTAGSRDMDKESSSNSCPHEPQTYS